MDEHALRSLKGARGPCPPAEDLVAYEALGAEERTRHPIDAHMQMCSRCQLVLLHLDDAGASASAEATADKESPGLRTHPWILPLAAALVIALILPFAYRMLTPASPPDTIRGSEIQPIAPIGSVTGVPTFEWQSPMQAANYRLTVFRGSEIVWNLETKTPPLTPAVSMSLPPGEYSWQVEALDREGTVRMSSPLQKFQVTGGR